MSKTTTASQVIRGTDAETAVVGSLGCRFLLEARPAGSLSVVGHTLAGHRLGAPVHRHSREDEYSFITSGTITALLGDEVVTATAGDLIVKPRGQWHTFWNATDEDATLVEIIAPGGFERYFAEADALLRSSAEPPLAAIGELAARYGMDIRPESIPELCRAYGLTL